MAFEIVEPIPTSGRPFNLPLARLTEAGTPIGVERRQTLYLSATIVGHQLSEPDQIWIGEWIGSVAEGSATMSHRPLTSFLATKE
jgi:hypothetical protein